MPDETLTQLVADEVLREKVRHIIQEERRPLIRRVLEAPLVSVIVAALLGALLTHYYDRIRLETEHRLIQERAEADRISSRHEAELAKMMEIFESVSRLLDKRLWATRQLIWTSGRSPTAAQLQEKRLAYQSVVDEWNGNLNRNLALVGRYFGDDARAELEGPLSDSFRRIHRLLGGPHDLKDLDAAADRLNRQTYDFNRRLLAKTVGSTTRPANIGRAP